MKVSILDDKSTYEFELQHITQLCGTNFAKKIFIVESLEKHFSTYKYQEYEEIKIENVLIDGQKIGRKYFELTRLRTKEDIIKELSIVKTSLMMKLINMKMTSFECQEIYMEIAENLEQLYEKLNSNLLDDIKIELGYKQNAILEIVQKSITMGAEEHQIEEMSNYDLVISYIEILKRFESEMPDRRLIIFEDVDHLLTREEYIRFVLACEKISNVYNIYFVFLTSIPGYVYFSSENLEGISVVNESIFTMPDKEQLVDFMKRNYPCTYRLTENELFLYLSEIIHSIGKENDIISSRNNIIRSLFNMTLMCSKKKVEPINELEYRYLLENC